MIPEEKIEEIRSRASIVDVVGEYVALRKKGANYFGICPFHSEKTPSFSVSDQRRIFHCFGCGETGNVISFLMKKEGMTFPDAARSLASRYGITIEEARGAGPSLRTRLLEINRLSAEYFTSMLFSSAGKAARDYVKGRGFTDAEFVRRFGLGYAPEGWNGLLNFLGKKGIRPADAEKAGVVILGRKGHYDRFRSRLIFPITDARGSVIGFGGRTLTDDVPKYLNSPETMLFRKGAVFYGLSQARRAISEAGRALVVEGYFDLLALHRDGFENTVATMGTALTVEHIRSLKGFADSIYALFDTDDAGRAAAVRALKTFLEEDISCRAVMLPEGKDPDEFLASGGPDGMRKAIEDAEPLFEFFLKELRKRFDLKTPEGKKGFLNEAVPYLKMVKNPAERAHYSASAASVLGISSDAVNEALGGGPSVPAPAGPRSRAGRPRTFLAELTILTVLLKHPELFDERVVEAFELFEDVGLKTAALALAGAAGRGQSPDAAEFLEEIEDKGVRSRVAEVLLEENEEGFVVEPEKMLADSLKKLLNRGRLKVTTEELIKQLEESGKTDAAKEMRERARRGPGPGGGRRG